MKPLNRSKLSILDSLLLFIQEIMLNNGGIIALDLTLRHHRLTATNMVSQQWKISKTRTPTMREKQKDIGKEEEVRSDMEITCVHLNLHFLLLQNISLLSTTKIRKESHHCISTNSKYLFLMMKNPLSDKTIRYASKMLINPSLK